MISYLKYILNNKSNCFNVNISNEVKVYFQNTINNWAGDMLNDFFVAGSSAKGVSIKGKSDIDLFVSIKSSCDKTLSYIYDSLFNHLKIFGENKFSVLKQNVSIGVKGFRYKNIPLEIDIVPAKQQNINSNFHSLFKSKQGSWMQTNVKGQIDFIRKSGRQDFIKLIKIWRNCHGLEFPSINIELVVLKALKGKNLEISLETGFQIIMEYLSSCFLEDILIDKFNSNNVVSNDMTFNEKINVVEEAKKFFCNSDWNKIIW